MHPILERAQEESQELYRRAHAQLQAEKDLALAKLMAGPASPAAPAPKPQQTPAPKPQQTPAPVKTDAEREASRIASFAKLSASDQALLTQFGAAPFSPDGAASTPVAKPAPAQSAYDIGASAAARLLGKSAPAPFGLGESAFKPQDPAQDTDPRFDQAAMERGSAEARRSLGKST